MRGATCASIDLFLCLRAFQSTLLMRGATARLPYSYQAFRISIHAPHARSDVLPDHRWPRRAYFNPRSSCEERPTKSQLSGLKGIFQSTLLMRGATLTVPMTIAPTIDFNPRSSCEERRTASASTRSRADFNPRSSCEERRGVISLKTADRIFQSTLLMRGATSSIRFQDTAVPDFNPRSSCEERRAKPQGTDFLNAFQSTLLMRGATIDRRFSSKPRGFQSTLLMRGATRTAGKMAQAWAIFQSTLLMRGATTIVARTLSRC